MDPLSITVAIVGVAAVALHSTRRTMEFIDGIQGAPQAVKALSRDLSALEKVLQALNDVLNHPDFQGNARRAELAALLQDPLDNCILALEDISLAIRPYTKTSGDSRKSKWRGFTWSFREKEIVTLQRMLTSYKSSLTMAVAVANLSTTSTGFSDTKGEMRRLQRQLNIDSRSMADSSFQGSEAAGSDPGFTLKRYLLQPDLVFDTPTPPSPVDLPDLDTSGLRTLQRLACAKNTAAFNETDGQRIYELGHNISEGLNLSSSGAGMPKPKAQTTSNSSPNLNSSKSDKQKEHDFNSPEPPVFITNYALEETRSTTHPDLTETIELKILGPTFGVDLEVLYQRDGIFIPRVVQFCVAATELVARRMPNVYDIDINEDDIMHLKDRFDNSKPVQVNAQAVFDHRTVDPRKLSFFKGDQILVLELRGEKWFLGRRQDVIGLVPIDFVQLSVQGAADIIGTCKRFFMEMPNSIIPKMHYDSLMKAAGTKSAADRCDQVKTTIRDLPLSHFELLKVMILHLHRISGHHSDNDTIAMDLAKSWAPVLMRRNDGSVSVEDEQNLQVDIVHTLITSAEDIFESDQTERYADASFSSVTLMPEVKASFSLETGRSRLVSSAAPGGPWRSLWRSAVESLPHVVSKCTEIIEGDGNLQQVYYYGDVPTAEVIKVWNWLDSQQPPLGTKSPAPDAFAVATLLRQLIAAKPDPLIALDDSVLAAQTTATWIAVRSSRLSTMDGFVSSPPHRRIPHYEILKTVMLHLCRISRKYQNAYFLAHRWTPTFTHKTDPDSELRRCCDFVQNMIMNAYELFEEHRPQNQEPMIYELE